MKKTHRVCGLLGLIAAVGVAGVAPGAASGPQATPSVRTADVDGGQSNRTGAASLSADAAIGFTAPFRRVTLAPLVSGRLASNPADEGAVVKEGEIVVRLDDAVQRTATALSQLEAESKLDVELARVRRDAAALELDRVQALAQDQRASAKELSDASALAEATRIEWQQAEIAQLAQERDYALQMQRLSQYSLAAPFAGYVAQRSKQAGDGVDELEPVLVLAQLDPLEVVVEVPLSAAAGFRVGETVMVSPADPQWSSRNGTVTLVNQVGNPASQTTRLKLRVENPDLAWPAGLQVRIPLTARPLGTTRTAALTEMPACSTKN